MLVPTCPTGEGDPLELPFVAALAQLHYAQPDAPPSASSSAEPPMGVGVRGSSSKLAGLLRALWPNIVYTVAMHSNMQLAAVPSARKTHCKGTRLGYIFRSQEMLGAGPKRGPSSPVWLAVGQACPAHGWCVPSATPGMRRRRRTYYNVLKKKALSG